jgi:hypothetical protein
LASCSRGETRRKKARPRKSRQRTAR